ncbi:MAG: GAF domain-containing protein [Anaerolineae bacterium]|nr:GAF domain-containing protein [Anaerolineae bacterium]
MMAMKESTLASRLHPRGYPIAFKLVLGLALGLLIGGLIINFVVQQALRNAQIDLALGDLQDVNHSQALYVIKALQHDILVLEQLGADARIERVVGRRQDVDSEAATGPVLVSSPTLDPVITGFMEDHKEFEAIVVLDSSGHVLSMGIGGLPEGFDSREMPAMLWDWYTYAWNNGRGATYVAGHVDDPFTEKTGVHIAVPIYSSEASRVAIGVIYAVWNVQPPVTTDRTQMLIIEQNGTVVSAQSGMDGVDIPVELTGNLPSGAFLSKDNWLYSHISMADIESGDPTLSNLPWIFAIRQSADTSLSGVTRVAEVLRWMTVIGAILVAVLMFFFARSLMLPLGRLVDVVEEIRQGELSTPFPQFPPDEIGRLSQILSDAIAGLLNRIEQLRAALQVSHTTMITLEIDKMLEEVVLSLSRYFHYQDVRIFLVDSSGKRARLQAAAGEESERLLQTGFRVEIDDATLVGRSILLNEALISAGKEEIREPGPNAKYSEMTLPIQIGGEAAGSVHLISNRMRDFSREDMNVLRLITDQLSAAIQNARLFEQSAANLAEIEALNRRLTRQAWEEFMGEGGALRRTLDPEEHWPQVLEEARQSRDIKADVYTDADGRSVLAAPLVSRGETVGTLAVTRPSGEIWTRDEVLLLESIAARMGIIAEGIRLVEESTQRVEREQRVNEVSANLLQRASSVDTVLRSALNELSAALGSDRVSLRIGGLPARDGRQISSGFADGGADAEDVSDVPGSLGRGGDGGITNV